MLKTAETKADLENQHKVHLARAEKARSALRSDGLKAKENKADILTLSIDLQKALPFPRLSVSDAYYRRNMYCYNLGVHDLATGNAVMYVWDECIASRGSQEIASAILKHIDLHASTHYNIQRYMYWAK